MIGRRDQLRRQTHLSLSERLSVQIRRYGSRPRFNMALFVDNNIMLIAHMISLLTGTGLPEIGCRVDG